MNDTVTTNLDRDAQENGCFATDWPNIIPIEETPTLPIFPLEALGELAPLISGIAESYNVTPALPAGVCLAVIAAAVLGRYDIAFKPGWTDQLSLYMLIVAESGGKKSTILKLLTEPLVKYERELQENNRLKIKNRKTEREALEKRRKACIDKGETEEACTLDKELLNKPELFEPRLLAADATPEKLALLMSQNQGKMAIFTAEDDPVQQMAGKYRDGKVDCNLILQAFTGDSITQDRIGRDNVKIDHPALTICLCVQPVVLKKLDSEYFTDKGLLPRFTFLYCPGRATFNWEAPELETELKWNFFNKIEELLRADNKTESKAVIRFSPEATEVLRKFCEDYQEQEGSLRTWQVRHRARVGMLAAILELYHSGSETVSAERMEQAVILADYLEKHAAAVYGISTDAQEESLDRRIIKWITEVNDNRYFQKRELWQWIKGNGLTASDVYRRLPEIEERGYIRQSSENDKKYEVNPRFQNQTP
ncbi:MAG: YfjI family protein [Phycisphaerae bacterium]